MTFWFHMLWTGMLPPAETWGFITSMIIDGRRKQKKTKRTLNKTSPKNTNRTQQHLKPTHPLRHLRLLRPSEAEDSTSMVPKGSLGAWAWKAVGNRGKNHRRVLGFRVALGRLWFFSTAFWFVSFGFQEWSLRRFFYCKRRMTFCFILIWAMAHGLGRPFFQMVHKFKRFWGK